MIFRTVLFCQTVVHSDMHTREQLNVGLILGLLCFLADRTIGRAFGTLCRLSVCLLSVCL